MKLMFQALAMCLSTFTVIPVPQRDWNEDARGLMPVCLPVVGVVVGLLWYLLVLLGGRLVPAIQAALIVSLPWILTGFSHLDGFMDTSDALLSWRPLEQRLRILKDPHAGAFAIVSMALLAIFSYAAAASLAWHDMRGLLFVPVISRCCSAFCVLTLRPLKHSEYLGAQDDAVARVATVLMWVIEIALAAIWLKGQALALLFETIAYALAMSFGYRTLKGMSGDVAGYALAIAECAGMIALTVLVV